MGDLGLGNDTPSVYNPPTEPGNEGDIKSTSSDTLSGKPVVTFYKFTDGKWERLKDGDAAAEQAIASNSSRLKGLPEIALPTAGTGSLRYPNKDINENGDYVLFTFKKYQPPFGNRKKVEMAKYLIITSLTNMFPQEKTTKQS